MLERQAVMDTSEQVLAVRSLEQGPLEAAAWDWSDNTLVQLSDDLLAEGEFWIRAGNGFATALVTSRLLDAAPGEPDSEWEDVVELSLRCSGPVGVTDLVENDPWVELIDEPGRYRLRFSVRGRLLEQDPEAELDDDDQDLDSPEPVEFYLLEAWPEPNSQPAAVLRLTSAFSRHNDDNPRPLALPEVEPGLAASIRIGRDVDRAPGARTLSGQTCSVEVDRTVRGTRRRLFLTCARLTSWSQFVTAESSWTWGGYPTEEPGRLQWAESGGHADQLSGATGVIQYSFVEVEKPGHAVRQWNWLAHPSPGTPYIPYEQWIPVLAENATVTMRLSQSNDSEGQPWTEIRYRFEGIPVEWIDDMRDWLSLQLAIADHLEFGVAKQ